MEPRSLTERVQWEMGPPLAFAILKNVPMMEYNLHTLQRERARKDTFISVQNGTVEYVHGPVTPRENAYRMPWLKHDRVKTLKAIYVLLQRDPNTIQPANSIRCENPVVATTFYELNSSLSYA